MLPTMQSGMTQESTGFATLCTSIGSSAALPLPGRNTGVYVAGDTCTTKLDLLGGQTGRETTPSPFVDTVEPGDVAVLCCQLFDFLDIVVIELKILDIGNLGTWSSI